MKTIFSILISFVCAASAQTNIVPACTGAGQRQFNPWYVNGDCSASILYPDGTVNLDTNGQYWLHPTDFNEVDPFVIGLVDTGILSNSIPNVVFQGININTGELNPYSIVPNPRGDTTHGTKVAQVLVGPNGIIRTYGMLSASSGVDDFHQSAAMQWLVNAGAKVIVYPYGWSNPQTMISNVIYSNSEVVFVCSGPEGYPSQGSADYPTSHNFSNIVRVVGVNRAGDLYGSKTDSNVIQVVGAPGRIIFPSTNCYVTGTSYAVSFVAGALGIIMHYNKYTARQALDYLFTTLEEDSDTIGKYKGRIRLDKLLSPDSALYHVRLSDTIKTVCYTYGPNWYQIQYSPDSSFSWYWTKEVGYGDSRWHTNEFKIDTRFSSMYFRLYREPANW